MKSSGTPKLDDLIAKRYPQIDIDLAREWLDRVTAERLTDRAGLADQLGRAEHHVKALLKVIDELRAEQ
ncbi:MAG: hypothetical protein ACRD0A_10175 [Acidimicrobiales bacterium]